jgi:DNA replication protein DnaC
LTAAQAPQTKEKPVITLASDSYWDFETFDDPQLEKMLHAAMRFTSAMQLDEDPHWLCLLGPSGAGKTHLSKSIIKYWREKAGWWSLEGRAGLVPQLKESRFISWRKFIDRQKAGEFSEIQSVVSLPFVVIDDFGAEHDPTGFAKSRLDRVADERLGKWTVFTSNLLLNQIAKEIDPRISSRMIRGQNIVIEVDVTDYNIRKRRTSPQISTTP